MSKKTRPNWPFRGKIRMTAHPNGSWCKRIRGTLHYFGRWQGQDTAASAEKAIAQYNVFVTGGVRIPSDSLTLGDLVNLYYDNRLKAMEAGELSPRTMRDYMAVCKLTAATIGKDRYVTLLGPDDFESLRKAIPGGAQSKANRIVWIRSIFKWAKDNGHIKDIPNYGTSFRKPSARVIRIERRKRTVATIDRAALLSAIEKAKTPLKAMILLGINGGFGNTDVASLPLKEVDLVNGIIRYDRPKTGVEREVTLWPETVEALRTALKSRPEPLDHAADLFFVTRFGAPWIVVQQHEEDKEEGEEFRIVPTDSIRTQWGKLGIAHNFYDLRHTFRTKADEANDQHAVARIMGHALPGMADVYVNHISIDRIRAVTEYVRRWLFTPAS